jgi:hypothetical protein
MKRLIYMVLAPVLLAISVMLYGMYQGHQYLITQ